jgi:dihydrolipoamide dehydrogenase
MRYNAMPSVLYTSPEMAFVGETEETATAKGLTFEKKVLPMNFSGRYMAENEGGDGIIKLLVDPDHQRILGCHLLGSYASEIILAAGILVESEMRVEAIKELVFPHPTVAEVIREAIFH